MTAMMEVSLEHPKFFDAFAEQIQGMDSIVSCYYQTGDFDLLLKISCRSSEELEDIHRQVMSLTGVSATRTHVVLKTVKIFIPRFADRSEKERREETWNIYVAMRRYRCRRSDIISEKSGSVLLQV